MTTDAPTGTIVAEFGGANNHPQVLAISVIDPNATVRARGVVGTPLQVPSGRYLVCAYSPDGEQVASSDLVELKSGEELKVALEPDISDSGGADARPQSSAPESEFAGVSWPTSEGAVHEASPDVASAEDPFDLTHPSSRLQVGVIHARWMEYLRSLKSRRSAPPDLQPFERVTGRKEQMLFHQSERDTLLQIIDDTAMNYFAVPFDQYHPTLCQVVPAGSKGRPTVRFGFVEPRITDLLRYVAAGQSESARAISSSIIDEATVAVEDKSLSPLLATVACYVLLRANRTEGLSKITANLRRLWAHDVIPDAHILHMEALAREGDHDQAIEILVNDQLDMPVLRSGVGYLEQRLQLYAHPSTGEDDADSAPLVYDRERVQDLLRAVTSVSWALDVAQPFCTYRFAHAKSARSRWGSSTRKGGGAADTR